eukprot:6207722-Pleurochrysis_carterae.AAC.2
MYSYPGSTYDPFILRIHRGISQLVGHQEARVTQHRPVDSPYLIEILERADLADLAMSAYKMGLSLSYYPPPCISHQAHRARR